MQPKPVEEPEAMPPPPRGALNPYIVEQSVGSIKAVGVATVHSAMAIGTTTMSRVASAGSVVVTGLEKTGVTAGFQAVFGKGIDKSDAGLEAAFTKVDTDKSGKINAEEMKAYIQSVYEKAVDDKTIGEMMAAADTNQDSEIDLAEFKIMMRAGPKNQSEGAIKAVGVATLEAVGRGVKATGGFVVIGLEKTFDTLGVTQGFQAAFGDDIDKSDAGLEAAFVKVDTDKSGKINAEEMKADILSVYPKGLNDRKIAQMMAAADTNKDGEIDLAEFKVIMRAGPPVGAIDNFLNMCMHPPREIEEWAIPPPRSPPALTSTVLTPRAVSPSTRHALSPPRQTQLGTQRPTL